MAKVKVQIPIRKGYHGTSWLLERIYDMDFLPLVGESIHALKNDPNSGLTFEIHQRWWDENGGVTLEIAKHIIDPPDDGKMLPRTWQGWFTARDGDLVGMLRANGWSNYGG